MHRHSRGGVILFICLFISLHTNAQIKLISGKDGKPVNEAIINIIGNQNEHLTCISDQQGVFKKPPFAIKSLIIFATGYKTLYDTLNGSDPGSYILVPLKIEMGEVVITGQYHANEAANSIYQIQVFDQKNIELKAANNLSDLLEHENAILISRDPFLGAGININGITGNNVKILQDGVPVIGRENGSIDVSQLDLSEIERVELVRGPMSETYGSDALAGVINLISKKKSKDGIDAGIKLYYESNGTYNAHMHTAFRKKKNEFTLHGGRNFFDGYSEFDTLRSKQWKPKEQYLLDGGYTYHFSSGYIRYQGNFSKEKLISKGNIIATPYEAYAFDDYFNTIRMSHKIFADKELNNHASINLTNAYSHYERSRVSYRKDMVALTESGLPSNDYSNLFRQFLFRGTYSTFKAWKKINYQVGYDITFDESRGDRTGTAPRRINDFALFGSTEISSIKKVLIRPAVRLIYNTKYPAPIVPSLHVKYEPFHALSIRASYARGFRAPSVKELYLDFEDSNHNLHGNTNLKPELSDYAQVSFVFLKEIRKVQVSIQPDIFYNHIYNKISLAQLDANILEYTYINLEDYRNTGCNLQGSASYKTFSLSAGMTYTFYRTSLAGPPQTPPYSKAINYNSSVSWHSDKTGLSAGIFFKHTGTSIVYSLENETIKAYKIDSYNSVDCSIGKSFFKNALRIQAGLKNILNITTTKGSLADGEVHANGQDEALVGMGRYYFTGIQYNFGKK